MSDHWNFNLGNFECSASINYIIFLIYSAGWNVMILTNYLSNIVFNNLGS